MSIKSVVWKARNDFESGVVDTDLLMQLYSAYNVEVNDTRLFVARAKLIFPLGNCGLASLYLQHMLGTGKVVHGTYNGNPHTFLNVDNNIIADITADQFEGPKVFVGALNMPWRETDISTS